MRPTLTWLALLPLVLPVTCRVDFEWSDEAPEGTSKHLRAVFEKRQVDQTGSGEPINSQGQGAPFSGGTNRALDLQNPSNLGQQKTDAGTVVNLKWAFSDSHTRLLTGGWVREQVVTDLPSSPDIAAAQQHLTKGAMRELHWHRVAEWGYLYAGQIALSAVDENGRNQVDTLNPGDIWYFPKGQAHMVEGLADQNEYLLVFDDGNFDAAGTTFNVDDWLAHTPKDIVAKNFGVDTSFFNNTPTMDPYIVPSPNKTADEFVQPKSPIGSLAGNSSYVYHLSQKQIPEVPGGGGTLAIVDSRNFPVSTTIASAVVTLKPGAMREMHWHPTAAEWVYFLEGEAQATIFLGGATARTFNFRAGDTANFPDNSGHYVINTSNTTELKWIEIYSQLLSSGASVRVQHADALNVEADHVADISLTQWLALTPSQAVARTLNVSVAWAQQLNKVKQYILK